MPPGKSASLSNLERDVKVHVRFRIPYATRWGQQLLLVGAGALLGNWNPRRGHLMSCTHEKEGLVWEVELLLPWARSYSYKYAIVRKSGHEVQGLWAVPQGTTGTVSATAEDLSVAGCVWAVDTWCTLGCSLALPSGLSNGVVVEVSDTWVDASHPSSVLSTAAFAKVICTQRPTPVSEAPVVPPTQSNTFTTITASSLASLQQPEGQASSGGSSLRLGSGAPASLRVRAVAFAPEVEICMEPVPGEVVIHFVVADLMLAPHQTICVSGSLPELGNWMQDQALELTVACLCPLNIPDAHEPRSFGGSSVQRAPPSTWEGSIRIPCEVFPFSYKYSIVGAGEPLLEAGESRVVTLPAETTAQPGGARRVRTPRWFLQVRTQLEMCLLVRVGPAEWRERPWRGAGVAIPVFSCRTESSVGVGEFLDLIKMVDLSQRWGLHLIQLLPVNDTSVHQMWWDSYPYSSLSVHALHPLYLSLAGLRRSMPADLASEIEEARIRLSGSQVDYEATMAAKLCLAKKVFDRFWLETQSSAAYQAWFRDNSDWLKPYAAFCFLRDLFKSADHTRWGLLSSGGSALVERLTAPGSEAHSRVEFTYYLQFHLHSQLLQVSTYAAARHVVLKGDLPIGVDKCSVDTWMAPGLFRMDQSTGAPPDDFSAAGQNWGFPTYNWEAMARDNCYGWWKRRLKHMAQYFSAYRIDHVLGFFRIWEIPGHCTSGLLGHFRPSLPFATHELAARGLHDMGRLTQPYIRKAQLAELFGELAEEVSAKYLLEPTPGVFKLRPAYSTEVQIAAIKGSDSFAATVSPTQQCPKCARTPPEWLTQEVATTKAGLLQLRQEVLMMQDEEDPTRYHPRFSLSTTHSFAALPPAQQSALRDTHNEYFFSRHEELWRASGLAKLPAIMGASDMLVCGEDLGFVPACVPPAMQDLGMIGLRIQRMTSDPSQEFNNPAAYPYLTVASPSCHDTTTTRAWYESDPDRAERYYCQVLGGCGEAPAECIPEVMRVVVQQHLNCPSLWAIFPLQDLMALSSSYTDRPSADEVINDPTNARHYWRYRVHVTLETLLQDDAMCKLMQEMVRYSDRACPAMALL
ncbi:MAG: hypothetical protein WDW38_010411 [Sanguina aurantia]